MPLKREPVTDTDGMTAWPTYPKQSPAQSRVRCWNIAISIPRHTEHGRLFLSVVIFEPKLHGGQIISGTVKSRGFNKHQSYLKIWRKRINKRMLWNHGSPSTLRSTTQHGRSSKLWTSTWPRQHLKGTFKRSNTTANMKITNGWLCVGSSSGRTVSAAS